MIELTQAEQATRSYAAALDSVNLINGPMPEGFTVETWSDTVNRNKEHLRIQLAKVEFYSGFDMTAIEAASEDT